MVTNHVVVLPYNGQLEQDFLAIKGEITSALGQLAMEIEHVGNTSVENLSAKPIIDIDVVIKDYTVFEEVVSVLETIGIDMKVTLASQGERHSNMMAKKI